MYAPGYFDNEAHSNLTWTSVLVSITPSRCTLSIHWYAFYRRSQNGKLLVCVRIYSVNCPLMKKKTYMPCEVRANVRHRLISQVYFWHTFVLRNTLDLKVDGTLSLLLRMARRLFFLRGQNCPLTKKRRSVHAKLDRREYPVGRRFICPRVQ